jgi:ABC-2 type transport system ATP-binding protein
MLLGVLLPTAGHIEMLGHDMRKNRWAALRRMNFSSPYIDLPRKLTVRQNLSIYGRLYGVADVKAAIGRLGEELDLSHLLDRPFGALSAGQQTRASLAKAFINTPELLLLDEPTASLDPDTADGIRNYLDRMRRQHGMTILLASHNMREVERLCDNVIMMKQGKVVGQGTPQELMKRYDRADMEAVFLHIARGREEEL